MADGHIEQYALTAIQYQLTILNSVKIGNYTITIIASPAKIKQEVSNSRGFNIANRYLTDQFEDVFRR